MTIERRFCPSGTAPIKVETRADGKRFITGYAAVFFRAADPGTEYQIWDDMVERIMPGAFDQVLKSGECVGLINHDRNHVLGRRSAKTLELSVDDVGLRYEIEAPDRQDAKDLIVSLERGDVRGSSFSFLIGPTGKVVWVEEGERTIREIHAVHEVMDVGPVTFPAYESTTAGVRAIADLQAVKAERDNWRLLKSRDAAAAAGELMAMELQIRAAEYRLDELAI